MRKLSKNKRIRKKQKQIKKRWKIEYIEPLAYDYQKELLDKLHERIFLAAGRLSYKIFDSSNRKD
jgi:hypothetical protein